MDAAGGVLWLMGAGEEAWFVGIGVFVVVVLVVVGLAGVVA